LLVAELESLVWDHPLRERLRAQQMLAFYRSGRQPEALEAYRKLRGALVDEFGIEPGPALQELERAILVHDPSLDLQPPAALPVRTAVEPEHSVLLLPSGLDRLASLLAVAERLARRPAREILVAWLLADDLGLQDANAELAACRGTLDVPVRTAVFTTTDSSHDAVRLATAHDVELMLLDAPSEIDEAPLPRPLAMVLTHSPADVGVLAGEAVDWERGTGIYVPFGGAEHDWAALELAAQLAAVSEIHLRLVGTKAEPSRGRRDASRLLADASLSVQRVVGVDVEPLLADATEDALLEAVGEATLVVAGISPRWRDDGIGAVRRGLVRRSEASVLLVHRGARPGVLAPRGSRTRFSWSVEP
jgi:hypothetical protein